MPKNMRTQSSTTKTKKKAKAKPEEAPDVDVPGLVKVIVDAAAQVVPVMPTMRYAFAGSLILSRTQVRIDEGEAVFGVVDTPGAFIDANGAIFHPSVLEVMVEGLESIPTVVRVSPKATELILKILGIVEHGATEIQDGEEEAVQCDFEDA